MKAAVVYVSIAHQNTERVAKAIAEALSADLIKADGADAQALSQYDLIGFGSGVYNGKHHEMLFELVQKLPAGSKKAFVFSTASYSTPDKVQKYHEPLKSALKAKGFDVVGEFNCPGLNTAGIGRLKAINKGHPSEEDLNDARKFAKGLRA